MREVGDVILQVCLWGKYESGLSDLATSPQLALTSSAPLTRAKESLSSLTGLRKTRQ